eukprot:TRINITY_DN1355_c0_g2_i1.p2 TRINITY_DN1355_c0_g2~~TRINITY_DN1355_c0_g2_i1.p2  ORF type:complete len:139 (+),score=3.53 TRINITY_DN1355_c0_g2_i1:161-577(+)
MHDTRHSLCAQRKSEPISTKWHKHVVLKPSHTPPSRSQITTPPAIDNPPPPKLQSEIAYSTTYNPRYSLPAWFIAFDCNVISTRSARVQLGTHYRRSSLHACFGTVPKKLTAHDNERQLQIKQQQRLDPYLVMQPGAL